MIAESQFDRLVSDEEMSTKARRIDEHLSKNHGEWKRAYMSEETNRENCEFEAPNAEVVKEAYRQAEVPLERAYTARLSDESTPEWH